MISFFAQGRSYELDGALAETLQTAARTLSNADIEDAMGEARRIWAASFPPDYTDLGEFADKVRHDHFLEKVQRRASRAPLSHVLGQRDFFDHTFKVNEHVLDPRPETELLVAAALDVPFSRVLDLGTGSGAIVVSLLAARETTLGVATDLSAVALTVALDNATKIGVAERLDLHLGSWFNPVSGRFDLIVSNPPYIAADEMAELSIEVGHEPRMALTDEGDGLSCYRIIAAGAPAHLTAGGWLMVEIGPTQGEAVRTMFETTGFIKVEIRPDLDGRDRVVVGQKPL